MEVVERETVPVKNVSYLYARDPSLISYGRPWGTNRAGINNCKKNLIADLADEPSNIDEQLKVSTPDKTLSYYLKKNVQIANSESKLFYEIWSSKIKKSFFSVVFILVSLKTAQ